MVSSKDDWGGEDTGRLTEAFHFLLSNELPVDAAGLPPGRGECASSYDLQRLLSSPREERGPEVELLHRLLGRDGGRAGREQRKIESSQEAILVLDADRFVRCSSVGARRLLTLRHATTSQIFNYYFQPGKPLLIHLERPDRSVGVGRLLAVHTRWEGKPAYLVTVRDVTRRERTRVASQRSPGLE